MYLNSSFFFIHELWSHSAILFFNMAGMVMGLLLIIWVGNVSCYKFFKQLDNPLE